MGMLQQELLHIFISKDVSPVNQVVGLIGYNDSPVSFRDVIKDIGCSPVHRISLFGDGGSLALAVNEFGEDGSCDIPRADYRDPDPFLCIFIPQAF